VHWKADMGTGKFNTINHLGRILHRCLYLPDVWNLTALVVVCYQIPYLNNLPASPLLYVIGDYMSTVAIWKPKGAHYSVWERACDLWMAFRFNSGYSEGLPNDSELW
jgi:hypothetical protein